MRTITIEVNDEDYAIYQTLKGVHGFENNYSWAAIVQPSPSIHF